MAGSRRKALILLLTGIAMSAGVSGLLRNRPIPLETKPISNLPGFRHLTAGTTSGSLPDPFIGLETTTAGAKGSLDDLFAVPASADQVPVASFSDYNCPYCRVLTRMVAEEEDSGSIAVTWHELPLLGPTSVMSAKAALAARLQGAYMPMHARLMRGGIRPTKSWYAGVASELGLEARRLLADMDGPGVRRQLDASAGVARLFGIYGTPALVIGRTLVLGQISRADLRRLIEHERD